jgi:ankyrin repeat protein
LTSFNGHVDLARFLVEEHGAGAAAQDSGGLTLLHEASMCGQVDFARSLLVGHGADAAAQDKYGQTPLHEASSHHRTVMWVSPSSS